MTKDTREIPQPGWNLFLSQRQKNFEQPFGPNPNPSKQRTVEMREEVPASAGAQDMDTSGYELSDLEDIELFCENLQVELDAAF